jgi:hypothetical protein
MPGLPPLSPGPTSLLPHAYHLYHASPTRPRPPPDTLWLPSDTTSMHRQPNSLPLPTSQSSITDRFSQPTKHRHLKTLLVSVNILCGLLGLGGRGICCMIRL